MIWVVGTDGQKKKGRGVLKGFKASKKRYANGSEKLNIAFSENLGGTVGMNYRSFLDDVVVIMKRKLPLIGVRRWSDIHPTIHRQIVADIIVRTSFLTCVIYFTIDKSLLKYMLLLYALQDRWALEDTPETEEKILKIAKERYRGWRSTLSSTYKAYKTDAARLANVPEDLQREEWEWMIEYFGTDSKFQVIYSLPVC
jgi:hypothetical protein